MTALSTSQPTFVRVHQRGRRSSCLGGPLDVSDAANFVQCWGHADDFSRKRGRRAQRSSASAGAAKPSSFRSFPSNLEHAGQARLDSIRRIPGDVAMSSSVVKPKQGARVGLVGQNFPEKQVHAHVVPPDLTRFSPRLDDTAGRDPRARLADDEHDAAATESERIRHAVVLAALDDGVVTRW